MRISDLSSDVFSSDLDSSAEIRPRAFFRTHPCTHRRRHESLAARVPIHLSETRSERPCPGHERGLALGCGGITFENVAGIHRVPGRRFGRKSWETRSEEHTSELPSLIGTSYAA